MGGEDFDTKMVEFCSQWFDNKSGISLKGNKRALRKLRTQCEMAKKTLSASVKTTIEVECLAEGEDFTMPITRAKFEEICGD
jgi:heat shock 70kDa protein 1/2/6/8